LTQKKLLDSYALLTYLNREESFQKVQEALYEAQISGRPLLMNEINVGETYYILYRKRDREKADFFLDTVLVSLPIRVLPNSFEDVVSSARLKAQYPLSFADCFAASTARRENAIIMTGDPEFENLEHMVEIEWL
jgi:uncharacterized protein